MSVKSARRVIQILEFFAQTPAPATLTGVAAALDLPKSSALALIQTLEESGYLYQVRPSVGYYPTRRWLDQAQVVAANDPIAHIVTPVLERIRDETDETVMFAQRSGDHVLYLDVVESRQMIRYTPHRGDTRPLHATSAGKALLASLSPDERQRVLKHIHFRSFTPQTLTRQEALERELDRGARRGYWVAAGEHLADLTGVAATARIREETYAVAVAGPTNRLQDRLEQTGQILLKGCRRLESQLG